MFDYSVNPSCPNVDGAISALTTLLILEEGETVSPDGILQHSHPAGTFAQAQDYLILIFHSYTQFDACFVVHVRRSMARLFMMASFWAEPE